MTKSSVFGQSFGFGEDEPVEPEPGHQGHNNLPELPFCNTT